jgi:hypothetical protein
MRMIWLKALSGLLVGAVCAVLAPAASAAISPTVALNQSVGTRAGSTVNLGMDVKFAPNPTSDSPKDMTLSLPPGLLANASIDGGACLNSSRPTRPVRSGPAPSRRRRSCWVFLAPRSA